ncbi:MAG: hypothetical protein WBM40_16370 [Thiohalocapsa sp.]
MLGGIALAALLIGGVSTTVVLTDNQQAQAQQDNRAPVVEVQEVETNSPFID